MDSLTDVSFVFPTSIDSPERSRNLDMTIASIMRHFDSPVSVLEAGKDRHYFPQTKSQQLQYQFVEDHQRGFNHTRYLNRLYETVTTPIMVLMDADAIVPPNQLIETVEQIRQGTAVMGLPYDGSAYFVTEELANAYQQTQELGVLENAKKYLRLMNGRIAVGIAIVVDTEKYLRAGGENEFFTDWGPEDLERLKRMEIIYQKPVYRYPGYVFHLWHPRNNSQYHDPQQEIAFKQEYLKICGMTQKELINHVESWPWKEKFKR